MNNLNIDLQLSSILESRRDYYSVIKEKESFFEEVACEIFGIPHYLLRTKSRKREVVLTRQLCMWYLKKTTGKSLAAIGFEIGGKDHATVLHACKSINNIIDTKDARFFPPVKQFIETMNLTV